MLSLVKSRKYAIFLAACLMMLGSFALLPGQTVRAENTATEDTSGNIHITIYTNKDVDQIVMNSGTGEVLITPHTEYSDEALKGNNQAMDVNGDLKVDQTDYDIEKAHVDGSCKDFTAKERCPHCGATDINGDGKIDQADLDILKSHLDGNCKLADCYFHGTRVYREDDPNNSNGYIWTIFYTPTISGIDNISFKPQSVTTTDVRDGEVQNLQVHAEEYKNPEITKTWVDPKQDKYLINQSVTLYAVTPLETDSVAFQTNGGTITVKTPDSINYDKCEKTWKAVYTPRTGGFEYYKVTGQGEQSNNTVLSSKVVSLTDRIVDPKIVSNSTGVATHSYSWTTSSTDADGKVTTEDHTYTWYTITVTAVANTDTDYVVFNTPSGSVTDTSYSSIGANRVFSTSWDSTSSGESASASAYATIGTIPEPTYSYQVTFDPQDGSQLPAQTVNYDSLVAKPADPVRVGYTFSGWYREDRCINAFNFATDKVRSTLVLYAKWTRNNYTVTFNTMGGDGIATKTVPFDSTFSPPNNPIRDKYTFGGWYKDNACTQAWDFGADHVQKDITLYAKWNPITYKVSFNTMGGSDVAPIGVLYGNKVTAPTNPTLSGFNFNGWYKDFNCTTKWNMGTDTVTDNTVLYAKWAIGKYTVTFDSMGGSTAPSVTVDYNALITAPDPNPARAGYQFTGWYQDNTAENPWLFSVNTVLEATTLYAGWNPERATITFNTNGGSAVTTLTGKTDQSLASTALPSSTRNGYTLEGWYTKADLSGTKLVKLPDTYPVGTTNFYAKWTPNDAGIYFETDGGTSVAPVLGKTDQSLTGNLPTVTKEGYTFSGWYKTADCTGSVFTAYPDKMPAGTTTFFVKWSADKAYIRFNTDGKGYVPKMAGTTDALVSPRTLTTLSYPGYTFKGWFDNNTFTGDALTQLPEKYPIGTLDIFANWSANPSTLKFVTNGGSTIADMLGVTDQVINPTTFPTCTRDGYTLSGWFEKADFTGGIIAQLPDKYPVDGTTYFAKWTANPSVIAFEENGGSTVADLTGVTDQVVADTTLPSTITRAGYSFAGWFATSACDGTALTQLPATFPANGKTLYAKWTALPATITFEENGGTATPDMTGVTDQVISPTTLPVITKDHYTLDGWYDTADFSTTTLSALPSQYPAGGATYYAKWTPVQYTVTYDAMGGSAVTATQVAYDTYATSPDTPSLDGYVFKGWFKESSCTTQWNFSSDKITGDVTLYAKWEEGIPGPEVPLNDWSWSQINQVAELGLGESYFDVGEEKNITLSTGEMLTLQIYGFNHDQLADGTGNKTNITFGLKNLMAEKKVFHSVQNTSMYWNTSDIRTQLNTSVYNDLSESLKIFILDVDKQNYWSGISKDKLFLFSEKEINNTSYLSGVTESDSQYPIFLDATNKIKKLSNGTGIAASYWGRSRDRSDVSLSRFLYVDSTGYVGTNTADYYYNKIGVNFGFCIGNAPTNIYSVTYNSNGGSAVASTTATLNTALTAPAEPTKANYALLGWYKDAGLTQKWDFASDKITGNTTLYAKWGARITYDSQGGTAVSSVVVPCNATFDAPSSPSKDGYVFKGWFKESACLSPWTFVTDQPTGNTTLYAKWQAGLPDSSVPLNNWSWDQINQVAELGQAQSYFDIGETKDILIGGTTYTFQIYGFNHDDLADGNGKSNITFGMKDVLSSSHDMNPGGSNSGGWDGSDMRAYLNGVYTTNQICDYTSGGISIWSQLPADLKTQIKTVKKYTSGGNNDWTLNTSIDNLFLFSVREVSGTDINTLVGEGEQYPIFTNDTSRIKNDSNDGSVMWWLRSAYYDNYMYFTGVFPDGTYATAYTNAYLERSVSFGFCIGNAPTNIYTTTYESNGGSTVTQTTNQLNTTLVEPTAPTKANSIFDGWYKDSGLSQKWDFANDKVTASTTLYAKWKTLPVVGQALSAYTWDEIGVIADEGLGDVYFDVGATKDMTLSTGEVVTMQIYDFDHDDLADGSGKKSNITFGTKNLMATTQRFSNLSTTAGGWDGSELRAWLNTTLYSQLPGDVQIDTVLKKSSQGGSSTSLILTSSDKIFLFSEIEIQGVADKSYPGEGFLYPVFTDYSSRIKRLNNGSGAVNNWWSRSASTVSTSVFTEVGNDGYSNNAVPTATEGVAFGFCMGTAKDLPDQGTALKDCSWQQVANVANAGKGDDYWNVGDTKDMTLSTGETLTMQIYGFNHDIKADKSAMTNITFGSKTLLYDQKTFSTGGGNNWKTSTLRDWLSNDLSLQLPKVVGDSIIPVEKSTSFGDSTYVLEKTTDSIFLFSASEILGTPAIEGDPYLSGEGDRYSIFTDADSCKKQKKISGGSFSNWSYWTRSPACGISNISIFIDNNGNLNTSMSDTRYGYGELSGYGVAFGFCLGTSPSYQVDFDSQGGSLITSKEVGANLTTMAPITPTKSGQTFAGWYKDAAGTNEWNFTTDKVTGPTTLYAKWITLPAVGTALEACSWDQIAYISKAGMADTYFNVGDEKIISIDSKSYAAQICGFDHDDKSDGSGKAGITFSTKKVLPDARNMNGIYNYYGWEGSKMRAYLNGVTTTNQDMDYTTSSVYSKIENSLKTKILLVKKQTSGGYNAPSLLVSNDRLFLFSDEEVNLSYGSSKAGEGTGYSLFSNNSTRLKIEANGSNSAWWLRSSDNNSNRDFLFVRNDGGVDSAYAEDYPAAVSFGFCV